MGGGGSGESTSTIRFAPYVEEHHTNFLTINHEYLDQMRNDGYNPYSTIFQESQAGIGNAPPVDMDWMGVFYGAGYTFSSFPSLYDMFGKFMAGLDLEVLFTQVLGDVQDNSTIRAMTNAHADMLDEELTDTVLPRLRAGMRDINAVVSSSYYVAVSNVEAKRTHDLAKFDAELRYKLIPVAAEVWAKHLAWNSDVIGRYQEIIKFSILTKFDQDNRNYQNRLSYVVWPWTLLEQYRANLGALTGSGSTTSVAEGPDGGGGMLSGITGGMSMGGSVGGPWGAAAGGLLGLASSFF